ncbi:MAG: ABC transporter permease, partial [Fimbriimonadaceae bacterium]|nr:ABC transporter permease [Alphaproteobacteria bacterium]
MQRRLKNIFRLGLKELNSLRRDPVLVFLIVFTFTFAIYTVATGVQTELNNASIAIVDEDRSDLSRQIRAAFLEPYFKAPVLLDPDEIDPAMDTSRFAFVIDIPPNLQADVLAARQPQIQVNVDATAMTLAGNGAAYIQTIINRQLAEFLNRSDSKTAQSVTLTMRTKFNPNLDSSWFMSVMQIVSNITMLSLILSGAAVIRERERGTIEHLLVMPVTPGEIMLAKIWANGLAIVLAVIVSLYAVVQGVLAVRISGSIALFV